MLFNDFDFLASYGTSEQLPATVYPEIAFAGRSNVGKSSLLNKMMQRKALARVSSTPGKTVTVNFYGDDKLRFVDLPGYGYAKASISEKERWSELVEGYFTSGRNIKLVVSLVDMRRTPTEDDMNMLRFLTSNGYRFIVVMTKSDKLKKTEYNKRLTDIKKELAGFGDINAIPFSALNGDGIDKVRKEIEGALKA